MRHRRVPLRMPAAAMADLALLLLIFFLTTTYFQAEEGPVISLPAAQAGEEEEAEGTWSLYVSADGAIRLQGENLPMVEAADRIRRGRGDGSLERLLFYADRDLPYLAVHPVLEELRGERDLPVLLICEPESGVSHELESEEGS